MRHKCKEEGCTTMVLNADGTCSEHRRTKCKNCKKIFRAHITGQVVCGSCQNRARKSRQGSFMDMGR